MTGRDANQPRHARRPPANQSDPGGLPSVRGQVADLFRVHHIQAAIFDLDGTLIDSMPYWETLACDYLANCGVVPPAGLEAKLKAMTLREAADCFLEEFGLAGPPDQHVAQLVEAIAEHYRTRIPLKPGAREYLARLQADGLRLGIATATEAGLASVCLERLGVRPMFEFIMSCETIGVGKSQPDIFHQAAGRFGLEPGRIAVYEDALYAARTAAAAGFHVVGVADASAAADRAALQSVCDAWIEDYASALAGLDAAPA